MHALTLSPHHSCSRLLLDRINAILSFFARLYFVRHTAAIAVLALTLISGETTAADKTFLVQSLQSGGYILYFRHAQTEWSQHDRIEQLAELASCEPDQMRQLSEQGRTTARQVGQHLRRLNIPVGQVFSSEFCRSAETARLLDMGPVTLTRDIINANAASLIGGRQLLKTTARKRFTTPPTPGTNTILVAHGNVLQLAAGARPVEAGAAVIKPTEDGGFSLLGMIAPEDWEQF